MIIFGIFAILLCPTIALNSERPWWKSTIIYEVYIRSFMDSNGDGIGDLNGVIMKLDHFVDLNIDCLWLSPYSQSPMKDMGYDISDFMNIEPIFGTLADFETLAAGTKKRNIKLVMDLVINHTSDQHVWFQKSIKKIKPYTDYYIWKDPRGYDADGHPIPPNNWYSCFGGRAWTWNEERKQFYYHYFSKYQPDLNLLNPKVVNEVKKIITFWIRRGVDGFRLDAVSFFIENFNTDDLYDRNGSEYRVNVPETFQFIHDLRVFLDKKFNSKATPDSEIVFIAESVHDLETNKKYYGTKDFPIVHYPFNFDFLIFPPMYPEQEYISTNAEYFDHHIKKWLNTIPQGEVVNWVTESHDLARVSERLNDGYKALFVTLTMTLPGAVSIYYGQEIGMTGYRFNPDPETIVMEFRDICRNPMQWDDTYQAGFTTNKRPWLPVNPNYHAVNVELQKNQPRSHYKMFKTLSAIRRTETLKRGEFHSYIPHKWVYLFTRKLADYDTYIVIINFGSEVETFDLVKYIKNVPESIKVVTSSVNSHYVPESTVFVKPQKYSNIIMRPFSSVVFVTGPLIDVVQKKGKVIPGKNRRKPVPKKKTRKRLIGDADNDVPSQNTPPAFSLDNVDISDIASSLYLNGNTNAEGEKDDKKNDSSDMVNNNRFNDEEINKGPRIKPIPYPFLIHEF